MIKVIRGMLILCVTYRLIVGEWPDIPPEVIYACLDILEMEEENAKQGNA
jgi:hypothetical protein